MRNQYYSEFPSGFLKLISKVLKGKINVNIHAGGADFLLYSTDISPCEISQLAFFEVSYFVIKFFKDNFSIPEQIHWCNSNLKSLLKEMKRFSLHKNVSFRIVESRKNGSKLKYQKELLALEKKLSSHLRIDKAHPDFELRLREKGKYGLIGIRITKTAEHIDVFQKGSLRKEIAYLMNYLSEPSRNDVFLDPMCGGGLIPILRSRMAEYKKIIASDLDLSLLRSKLNQLDTYPPNFRIYQKSLESLSGVISEKVNKIVFDPPWGFIQKIRNLKEFYREIFTILYELSSDVAIIVILTPHVGIIRKVIKGKPKRFKLLDYFEGEVSGHKSSIIKIRIHR